MLNKDVELPSLAYKTCK